jgi:hypothetical protein
MRKTRPLMGLATLCVIAALAVYSGPVAIAKGPAAVGLGVAGAYAVLAGSTVTNTGSSVITGDLGVSPGKAVTGFPPGHVNGAIHRGDGPATRAKNALTTAYNRAAGRTPVTTVATQLGGRTLKSGVYDSASGTFHITGSVTLDAEGNPDAVFIFDTASTLVTASGSRVRLINGADACHVYWKVGSSATLGTRTTFRGNILALTSITLNTGANVRGRLLARNGAVTLDTNNVTRAVCQAAAPAPRPTDRPQRTHRPDASPAPTRKPTLPPTDAVGVVPGGTSGGEAALPWLALGLVGLVAAGWTGRRVARRVA